MNQLKSADLGNGFYKNPILHTDYSDPDAIRVGDDYYMVSSSFTDTPGLPLLHSKDLVNWKVVNYCLPNLPYDKYFSPSFGDGVWAPSIRFHEGLFYVCFPMPDEGIFMITASDPLGKWSEPTLLKKGPGLIDPCPFWDEDGNVYLVYAVAKSRYGCNNRLFLTKLSQDALSEISKPCLIYNGEDYGHVTTEGPKLYKRNGYYYIFAPAGGVKPGYQLAMRSKDIYGPYEVKKVLEQKDTMINGPHQGAWVDTVTGEDWFIHFQDIYAGGRIVHLQPMRWEDDWPVIGDEGKPVLSYKKPNVFKEYPVTVPDTTDYFEDGKPNMAWQWSVNHREDYIFPYENGNGISLRCVQIPMASLSYPAVSSGNLLMQKWPANEFDVTFLLDASNLQNDEAAGIILFGMKSFVLRFQRNGCRLGAATTTETVSIDAEGLHYTVNLNQSLKDYTGDEEKISVKIMIRRDGCIQEPELPKNLSSAVQTLLMNKYMKLNNEEIGAPKWKASVYLNNEPIGDFQPTAGRWVGSKIGVFALATKKKSEPGYVTVKSVEYNFF